MRGDFHPKLSVPRQGMVLHRPRLRAALKPVVSGGAASIVAGPGYGKTALVSDLAGSVEKPVVYMGLEVKHRDPGVFVQCLKRGLQTALPGCVSSSESAGSRDYEADPDAGEQLLDLLEGMAAEDGSSGLIILDDLHELGDSQTGTQHVRILSERLPSGWCLVLTSRESPPFPLEVQENRAPVVSIGSRTLRLTPSEVVAWASELWGVELHVPDARSLWRATEGWPAALVMLGQHIHSGNLYRRQEDLRRLLRRGRRLREYLANQVLTQMSEQVVQVLRTASPLSKVVFPRDEKLFSGGISDAENTLTGLVARGFFLTETGHRVYRLHPLVRTYLHREMERENPEKTRCLVEKSAEHLESVGEFREAVVLYLSCGKSERAVGPLKKLAGSYPNTNHAYLPPGLLEEIPEDLLEQEPWLQLARARTLQGKGEFGEAEVAYGAIATGDPRVHFQALSGRGFCLYALGRWEVSLQILLRAEKAAEAPSERAEMMSATGNVLLSLCRWDEAVDRWEMALGSARGEQRKMLEARIMIYRVRLFYLLGQYRTAERWARKAVRRAARQSQSTYAAALNAVATTQCVLGRYEDAAINADAAIALVESRRYAFLKPAVQLCLGAVAVGRRNVHAALEHTNKARDLAQKAGDVESEVWALGMLGDLFRRNRNFGRALQHHRRAKDLALEQPLARYESVKALCGIGMDLVVKDDSDEPEQVLGEVASISRNESLLGTLVKAQFYRSWVFARGGLEKEAARAAGEAMRIADEHGHIDFLVGEARVGTPILALADRYGHGEYIRAEIIPLLPSFLASYFYELAEGDTYPTDVNLGHPKYSRMGLSRLRRPYPSDIDEEVVGRVQTLTPREIEILEMIGEGMPNKVIAAKLYITEKTIKTHTHRIFRKLEVTNRLQAVLAFQHYQKAERLCLSKSPDRKARG